MNQLNDVRVDRYLELFPDESAVLGHVMKIGERHRLADLVQSLIDESLDLGVRADWDSIMVHNLDPKL